MHKAIWEPSEKKMPLTLIFCVSINTHMGNSPPDPFIYELVNVALFIVACQLFFLAQAEDGLTPE